MTTLPHYESYNAKTFWAWLCKRLRRGFVIILFTHRDNLRLNEHALGVSSELEVSLLCSKHVIKTEEEKKQHLDFTRISDPSKLKYIICL